MESDSDVSGLVYRPSAPKQKHKRVLVDSDDEREPSPRAPAEPATQQQQQLLFELGPDPSPKRVVPLHSRSPVRDDDESSSSSSSSSNAESDGDIGW